ncbi:reverse transcriptase domain-containing protein [Tanacetum coccineum]
MVVRLIIGNKVVRSHIGGEYVSPFLNLCAKLIIRHKFIALDIEKNHALEDMVNAIFEIGRSFGIDDEVVQDLRQQDDNNLQDERQDQPKEEEVEPRRNKRARIEKSFRLDFVAFMVENEYFLSRSIRMAQWKEAIKSEIDFILQIYTWELVVLLSGCKSLGYKWIFKKKMKADGTIDKYKARLIIKGFRQRKGLDYFDTYSPVTRITSIRMVLAIAALRNLEVYQMDVKPAFLRGDLKEEIYMNQLEGLMALGLERKVCWLVKSLYGLKKAPKQGHQILPYHVRMWIRN